MKNTKMKHAGYLYNNFGHVIQRWDDENSNFLYTYQNAGTIVCVSTMKEECFSKMREIQQEL